MSANAAKEGRGTKAEFDIPMWLLSVAALAIVVLGACVYFGLVGPTDADARKDAMTALTALLSAAALFAALRGVHLQREELRLQRVELADSRRVMQEQADAAKESAKVQTRLAEAQEALAKAQHEANGHAREALYANLVSDSGRVKAQLEELNFNGGGRLNAKPLIGEYEKTYKALNQQLEDVARDRDRDSE